MTLPSIASSNGFETAGFGVSVGGIPTSGKPRLAIAVPNQSTTSLHRSNATNPQRADSSIVRCGISLKVDFANDRSNALLGAQQLAAEGFATDEPEWEADRWTLRVAIDLLDVHRLEMQVKMVEMIAMRYSGKLQASAVEAAHAEDSDPCSVASFATRCLGLAHRVENIAAWAAFDSGRFQESVDRWRRLLEQGFLELEGLVWIGKSEFELSNFERARDCFMDYLQQRATGNAAESAYLGLAWSQIRLDEVGQAEQNFLKLMGTSFESLAEFGLASCRAAAHEWSAALRWLQLATRQDPTLKIVARREKLFLPMKGVATFERVLRLTWWDRLRMALCESPDSVRTRLLLR